MDGLSISELQEEAQQAFERFSCSQHDLADILTVDRSAISRAVRHKCIKRAAVQSRIIYLLWAVPVQRRSSYQGEDVRHRWVIDP